MNQTETNLARIEAYNKKHVNDTAFAITDEWDESKHPRAANGQFGSGGAKSSPAKTTKAPAKGNTTPAAKAPAKAKSTTSIPEHVSKAKSMLEAAFNQNWNTPGGKEKKKELQAQMRDFWTYQDKLPRDVAEQIYDTCYASLHDGEKPDYNTVKKLMSKLKAGPKREATVEIPKTTHHEDIFGGADGAKWEEKYNSYFKDNTKFMSDYTPEQLDKVLVGFKKRFERAKESIVEQKKESPNVPSALKQNYVGALADYQAALKLRQAKGTPAGANSKPPHKFINNRNVSETDVASYAKRAVKPAKSEEERGKYITDPKEKKAYFATQDYMAEFGQSMPGPVRGHYRKYIENGDPEELKKVTNYLYGETGDPSVRF